MENGRYEAFCIEGGRKHFYRWDLEQKIVVNDPAIDEVHFCNGTSDKSLVTVVKDGRADVPNILLQTAGKVKVYGYSVNHTRVEKIYEVKDRTKPEDYVYEETEVKRYDQLSDRIAQFEDKGIEDIVVIKLRREYTETGVGYLMHDYTVEQVKAFVAEGKTVLMHNVNGDILHYYKDVLYYDQYRPAFKATGTYIEGYGLYFETFIIHSDYRVTNSDRELVKVPNPKKLIIKNANGEVVAEYDGSNEITITI